MSEGAHAALATAVMPVAPWTSTSCCYCLYNGGQNGVSRAIGDVEMDSKKLSYVLMYAPSVGYRYIAFGASLGDGDF